MLITKFVSKLLHPKTFGYLVLRAMIDDETPILGIVVANALLQHQIIQHVIFFTKKKYIPLYQKHIPFHLIHHFHLTSQPPSTQEFSSQQLATTFILIDECHAFIHPHTKKTDELFQLILQCRKVLFITSTLMYIHSYYDMIPLISILRKEYPVLSPTIFWDTMGTLNQRYQSYVKNYIYMYPRNQDDYPQVSYHSISKNNPYQWLFDTIPQWIARGEDKIVIYTMTSHIRVLQQKLQQQNISCIDIRKPMFGIQKKNILHAFNTKTRHRRPIQKGGKKKTFRRDLCQEQTTWIVQHTMDTFVDKNGKPFYPNQEESQYIKSLHIPPMWLPAHICRSTAKKKLLWVATDKKGKYQSRYSEEWILVQREGQKLYQLLQFTDSFWLRFHQILDSYLSIPQWTISTLYALILKTLYYCHFRIGNSSKKVTSHASQQHYGLINLQVKHITVTTKNISFSFIGKAGQLNAAVLPLPSHPDALYIQSLLRLYQQHVSSQQNPDILFFSLPHLPHPTTQGLRDFLTTHQLPIHPKDFRTYHANITLFTWLKKNLVVEENNLIQHVIQQIAKDLSNTPAIVKESYLFTPLWVFHAMYPREFQSIIQPYSHSINSQLIALLQHFNNKDAFHWQRLLHEYKGISDKPISVLILNYNAFSVPLKGVRHLILLETIPRKDNYQRELHQINSVYHRHSHSDLPKKNQTIHIWKFTKHERNDHPRDDLWIQQQKKVQQLETLLTSLSSV